jgi:D-3-phosphoglycerate dehydrogenase
VSGTLIGIHHKERLVEINGYDVDLEPTEHLAFFTYEDRPGMVGAIGKILGDAEINIAGMQVARDHRGGHALVAMTVDSTIPAPVLADIAGEMKAVLVRAVELD